MMSHRRILYGVSLLFAVAGCNEPTAETPALLEAPQPQLTEPSCPTPEAINTQLTALFAKGQQTAATSKFSNIQKMVTAGKMTEAVAKMFVLVDWTLQQYRHDKLAGGQSEGTQEALTEVVGSLYCVVGLGESALSPGALGPDGAVAVIYPTTSDTLIKTETGWAEVFLPAGALPTDQPVLITLERIPETDFATSFAGPLATNLSQFPLYYEYSVSPGVIFAVPVTIGICLLQVIDLAVEPGSRLRLAHNITPTILHILPLAAPPPMDCGSVETASAAVAGPSQLARVAEWLLPPPLAAATLVVRGTCCLGGTTRTFSPFAAVDPIGFFTALTLTTQDGVEGTSGQPHGPDHGRSWGPTGRRGHGDVRNHGGGRSTAAPPRWR